MKKILVPVDFSKDSMNAFEKALFIANKSKTDIRVIHVRKSKDYDQPFVLEGTESNYGKTVVDFCDKIIEDYKDQYEGGGKFDYVIEHGKIFHAISAQATRDKTDMIVMGTHGVSGFEEFWLGSNSYKVVCKAPCPVLTVRHGFTKRSIRKVMLPIDAHRETRHKISFTAELASYLNAEVHVVDVRSTNRTDIKSRLRRYADQAEEYFYERGMKTIRTSEYGSSIVDVAIAYAVGNQIDLISIVTNQKGTPVSLGISSNAQQMVNHCPVPILSIQPKF
jgi:nucleotide-binding universal stress UspA family protein